MLLKREIIFVEMQTKLRGQRSEVKDMHQVRGVS